MTSRLISRRSLTLSAMAAAVVTGLPRGASAAFPERTLRIEVGFAAGGTVDAVARVLAHGMEPILGQSVIIENRPGGSGSIAANAAIVGAGGRAYCCCSGYFSLAVAPALVKLNYDTTRDLTAVSQVASVPLFMLTTTKSPFRSGCRRGRGGEGRARDDHLRFRRCRLVGPHGGRTVRASCRHPAHPCARIAAAPRRCRAWSPARCSLLWDTPTSTMQNFIQQGQLRALAVMSHKHACRTLPNIPAIDEAGLGGDLEVQAWQGVLVKAPARRRTSSPRSTARSCRR